jgi:hypothetical protein
MTPEEKALKAIKRNHSCECDECIAEIASTIREAYEAAANLRKHHDTLRLLPR